MKPIDITDANFEALVLRSNKTVLVDFTAEWCGPCKTMTPVVDLLASQLGDNAVIGKLDVDTNPEITAKYGVRNMPTFMMFKNGIAVDRIIGAVPLSVLHDRVQAATMSA